MFFFLDVSVGLIRSAFRLMSLFFEDPIAVLGEKGRVQWYTVIFLVHGCEHREKSKRRVTSEKHVLCRLIENKH